jgi:hypothetical protein
MTPHLKDRNKDVGHGTRMGFRISSVVGVLLFVAIITFFAAGPRMSVSDNAPGGDTNTPAESMAAPEQQKTPSTNSATANAPTQAVPQPPTQRPSP